jgi:hypothetical protein
MTNEKYNLGVKIKEKMDNIELIDQYEEIKILKRGKEVSKAKSQKNYVLVVDNNNKATVISPDKNNIYTKLNLVKNLTEKSAFEMKNELKKTLLKNTQRQNLLEDDDQITRCVGNKFFRSTPNELNLLNINRNHKKIKNLISDNQLRVDNIIKIHGKFINSNNFNNK